MLGSIEIVKVDCVCMAGVFVVKFAMTVNLVLLPISLVCQLTRSIVELALSLHSIEVPMALVVTSIFKYVFSLTMTKSFKFLSLVFGLSVQNLLRSTTYIAVLLFRFDRSGRVFLLMPIAAYLFSITLFSGLSYWLLANLFAAFVKCTQILV